MHSPKRQNSLMALIRFIFLIIPLFLQFSSNAKCSPIGWRSASTSQFAYNRVIRQQPMLESANAEALMRRSQNQPISPPHCSRATVTLAHSSRLTKRAALLHPNSSSRPSSFPSTQLSLYIGIGQTVCFTMAGQPKEDANAQHESHEEVVTVPKSNLSFIVGLARRHRKPLKSSETEDDASQQVLHSISVLDLEQYHAITERYRFAIPELETRCICECESGTANCAADLYKYGRCGEDEENQSEYESNEGTQSAGLNWRRSKSSWPPSSSVCHRTFFANQPTGRHCSKRDQNSSTARLCCQLRFKAHRERTFTALRLENAVSSVLLQYSQWKWQEADAESNDTMENKKQQNWVEVERRKVRIQLDGAVHNTVLSEEAGLKLSVLGLSGAKSSAAQLEAGVYFAENLPDGSLGELAGQMPVNRIMEHDFHKLGWLRLDEAGKPFVPAGDVFLEKIHHARVDDCAEQRFRSVLDASYYVNADNNATTQFKLAEPLSTVHKWIRSARVLDSHQRVALVRAREGLSLEVTLMAGQASDEADDQQKKRITFVHNSSRLADFTALLVIDRFSNSFLNLTLFNASGVLNGFVRPLDDPDATEIDGFSVGVPANNGNSAELPVSVQVRIKPYPLGSIHVICLRPDDANLSHEICRPVQSVYHELEVNTVRNEWSEAVGACKQCNQITAEGFAKYLNPANWTKGITSVSDALMLVSDIIGYFIAFMILYAFFTKVVLPVLGCCCTGCLPTPSSIFCKGDKK